MAFKAVQKRSSKMIINDGRKQDGDPASRPAAPKETPVAASVPVAVAPAPPAPASAPAAALTQTEMLMALLEKLTQSIDNQTKMAERSQKAEIEAEEKLRVKRERYAQNRGDDTKAVIEKQTKCLHLKGGKYRNQGLTDYAVYSHLFQNNVLRIRCMLCKMDWYPPDTVDVIFRGGEPRPNHTKIGWHEACKMTIQTTNKGSKGELAGEALSLQLRKEDIPDNLGVITESSILARR
jgi:hypothetical protein